MAVSTSSRRAQSPTGRVAHAAGNRSSISATRDSHRGGGEHRRDGARATRRGAARTSTTRPATRCTRLSSAPPVKENRTRRLSRKDHLFALLLDRGAEPFDLQVLYNTHFRGDVLWWLS